MSGISDNWRAGYTEAKEYHNDFLKLAKKLREIARIESSHRIEANQRAKVESKPDLLKEIASLDVPEEQWAN